MNHSEHKAWLKYFESSNGRIAFRDEAHGPAIMLVHGVPTSSWIYGDIIEILKRSDFRVVAPDMLGFGYRAKPEGYDLYSADNHGKCPSELVHHWSQRLDTCFSWQTT